jgi:hypothetical protein
MMDGNGSMESLLSGAGVAIAAAVLLIIVLTLFRSTWTANDAISLQSAASEICGDIGTAAVSSVAYVHSATYPTEGITIKITSDFVIASDEAGREFARPLPVRIYPGAYACDGRIVWNDTAGMQEFINSTFGSPGTAEWPLNRTEGIKAAAFMEKASQDMVSHPLVMRALEPLAIEKLFLFTYNNTSHVSESEPYVFVFQR